MIHCFLLLIQESSQRNVVSFENDLDFEVDLTNLETFGETMPVKVSKMKEMQKEQDSFNNAKKATSSPSLSKTKRSSEHFGNTSSSSQEEMNSSLTDGDDAITKTSQLAVSEATELKTEKMNPDSGQESDKEQACLGDSDDEKLVIDDIMSPAATPSKPMPQSTLASVQPPRPPDSESVPLNSESSSPKKIKRRGRQSKKAKESGDQLSEILRMQTAMFSSANDTAKFSTTSKDTNSPNPCMGSSVHPHAVSLVKPCVSSFLERHQNQSTATQETVPVINITREHKSQCQIDLLCQSFKIFLCSWYCHVFFTHVQKYCHKSCRLVQKTSKITRLQKKATWSTNSTVCKICCSWCAVLSP